MKFANYANGILFVSVVFCSELNESLKQIGVAILARNSAPPLHPISKDLKGTGFTFPVLPSVECCMDHLQNRLITLMYAPRESPKANRLHRLW